MTTRRQFLKAAAVTSLALTSTGYCKPKAKQEILKDLAKADEFNVLDFMELFQQADLKRSPYFTKDIHLNEYGHQFVSKTLHDFLNQNYLKTEGKN